MVSLEEKGFLLNDGTFYDGEASVIHFVAKKR
jgi:hypothetical protein